MAELIHHAQRQPHRQNLCVMSEEVRPVVVLVDDDAAFLQAATRWLEKENFVIRTFATAAACLEGLERTLPDVLCLDIQMPDLDGMEALERVLSVHPDLPVLMLTAETSVLTVVEAMKRGAYDYLSKPLDRTRLVTAIRNAAERHQLALRLVELEREARGGTFDGIIGRSTAMRGLFRQLDRVARADISVLIHGESGTGKELVAAALHQRSARSKGPFVAINCAAIPESLQESELFGHEKGAFTGALTRHLGRFEQANGGTLFLDEVGELSLGLQAKLLRVLQERRFHRVGGAAETHSDFRVVAASHKDLRDEVAAHRFREDLYFRLAVFDLEVPPLREREGDIPILTAYLLDQAAKQIERRPPKVHREVMAIFAAYAWPGNVRELQNAIMRAVVSAEETLQRQDLPAHLRQIRVDSADPPPPPAPAATPLLDATQPVPTLAELERHAIALAWQQTNGDIAAMQDMLQIGRSTLYRKLKDQGLIA